MTKRNVKLDTHGKKAWSIRQRSYASCFSDMGKEERRLGYWSNSDFRMVSDFVLWISSFSVAVDQV